MENIKKEYVEREALRDELYFADAITMNGVKIFNQFPAADVVSKEQYEKLREDFIDFVCSGIHNPGPYCKNATEECVDSYGYCANGYARCIGFNPDGRKYDEM